jgi:hypothetical protein
MTRSLLLFGIAGATLACQEYEIKETVDGLGDLSDDGYPDISVTPAIINFPDLDAAAGLQAQEIVIVSNLGTVDLHIEDLYVDDDAGPFSLNAISSPLIPSNSQAQFAVTFEPQTAATTRGYAYIESDDPDTPVAEIQLNGTGIAPVIDINPSEYDFGSLYVGCDSSQPLTITNIGTADLIVDNFTFSTASNDLSFDALEAVNGPLPWTIPPSQQVDVFVDYAPLDELSDSAFLTVTSNDPYQPEKLVTQDGLGEIFGENSDLFEQPIQGSTDIIFAVDRSCSMDENIENMLTNFGTFTSILAGMDADYHVAAIVGDLGCVNPGGTLYIDSSHSASQAETIINQMIDINAQTIQYGSNEERAFMQLETLLANSVDMNGNPTTTGCNAGLIRREAKLALVGVSDEPEQSVNNYSYYVSMFQSLKSNPDDVVIHAIGGDYPSGCGSNSAYTGMYEATVATGGLFLSICATDWGTHLEALAEGSAQDLTSFELTEWPVPETITVKVDGTNSTIGWNYNPTDNAIDFDPDYVPDGGQTIQVDYVLYGDCNQ